MKDFIKSIKKKKLLSVLALVLIIGVSIPFTLSFLTDQTPAVQNTFTAGKVSTEVVEKFDEKIKKNVAIKNTGDAPVYIRAAVIVNWQDEKNNYTPAIKEDYSIQFTTNKIWVKHDDGFYYYTLPVEVGDATSNLIDTAVPMINKDGYNLSIEILSSGIQSNPEAAHQDAWEVSIKPGSVTALPGGGE